MTKAIVDVYPTFNKSNYSEYILIHEQSTKSIFDSKKFNGNLLVNEVMADGFFPCKF